MGGYPKLSRISASVGVLPACHSSCPRRFFKLQSRHNTLEVSGIGGNRITWHYNALQYFAPRLGPPIVCGNQPSPAGFGISYTPFPDNSYAYNFPCAPITPSIQRLRALVRAVLPTDKLRLSRLVSLPSFNPRFHRTASLQPDVGSPTCRESHFKNLTWNRGTWRSSIPCPGTSCSIWLRWNHSVDTVVNYTQRWPRRGPWERRTTRVFDLRANCQHQFLFAGFSSSYNALQAKLDRKFSGGFAMTTSYTFGKGMGFQTGDDGASPSTSTNAEITPQRTSIAPKPSCRALSTSCRLERASAWSLLELPPPLSVVGDFLASHFDDGLPLYFNAPGNALLARATPKRPTCFAVKILHGVGPHPLVHARASLLRRGYLR